MSKAIRSLDAARAARNRAWRRLEARLVQAREDLTPRSILERAAGDFRQKARKTFDEAVAVASDNRVIVAATIAALALWFLRKPILERLEAWLVPDVQHKDADDEAD